MRSDNLLQLKLITKPARRRGILSSQYKRSADSALRLINVLLTQSNTR